MGAATWRKQHNSTPRQTEVDADDALGSMRIFLGKYVTPADSFGKFDPQKLKDTYAAVAMAQNLDPSFDPASLLDMRFLPE